MGSPRDRPALTAEFEPGQTVRFTYKNWRGKLSIRTARLIRLTYGTTDWHPEPQWLLEAFDMEKAAVRLFALQDMVPVGQR